MHLEGRPQITCIENCISQRPLQEDRHFSFHAYRAINHVKLGAAAVHVPSKRQKL